MNDNELFEQARRRVQKKIKGRQVTNKDVIVDQAKEIEHYRNKIQKMKSITSNKEGLNKKFEITIKGEKYIILYNDNKANITMLNAYLIKLVNEKEKISISKDNEFEILNKTREDEAKSFVFNPPY